MKLLLPALFLLPSLLGAQSFRYRDKVFSQVDVRKNIAYGSAVNAYTKKTETLLLDLYQPRGDTALARPAIVIVHGGSFVSGDKGGQFAFLAGSFAKLGYVAISINYRLRPISQPWRSTVLTDAAHDFKASVRWLNRFAKTYRVDTQRIAAMGASAGAFLVLSGTYVTGEGKSGNKGFKSVPHAVIDLWGGLHGLSSMKKGDPAVCIIHGTKDKVVSFQNAVNIRNRAIAVGVPYEYHPLTGAGHSPFHLYSGFEPDIIAFLWEQMRLGQIAGLAARKGHASPGILQLDHFAVAKDFTLLLLSGKKVSLPVTKLGLLCVDPAAMLVPQVAALGQKPRLVTLPFQMAVPSGLRGRSFHWQALRVTSQPSLRLLSNCVTTTF